MTYLRAPFSDTALREPPCFRRKLCRGPLPAGRGPPVGAGCISRLEVVQERGIGEGRPSPSSRGACSGAMKCQSWALTEARAISV